MGRAAIGKSGSSNIANFAGGLGNLAGGIASSSVTALTNFATPGETGAASIEHLVKKIGTIMTAFLAINIFMCSALLTLFSNMKGYQQAMLPSGSTTSTTIKDLNAAEGMLFFIIVIEVIILLCSHTVQTHARTFVLFFLVFSVFCVVVFIYLMVIFGINQSTYVSSGCISQSGKIFCWTSLSLLFIANFVSSVLCGLAVRVLK